MSLVSHVSRTERFINFLSFHYTPNCVPLLTLFFSSNVKFLFLFLHLLPSFATKEFLVGEVEISFSLPF